MTDTSMIIGRPQPTGAIVISGAGGRELLAIHRDGTVTGSVEDASEAGARFVAYLRGHLAPLPSGATDNITALIAEARAWTREDAEGAPRNLRRLARQLADALEAEKAHTSTESQGKPNGGLDLVSAPTSDEREALRTEAEKRYPGAAYDSDVAAHEQAAFVRGAEWAGFRRSEVPEPTCTCGKALGSHAINCPAFTKPQGEPSGCSNPSDANNLIEDALTWIGRAWDDGNASGLDGWIGPGRGAGEVDREAQHARTRMVHKAEAALRAAGEVER